MSFQFLKTSSYTHMLIIFMRYFSLQNGVRGLTLDMNDYKDDIWLCQGPCSKYTAFVRHL